MSSISSSTEDEFENIKEAVDKTFFTEDLYANDNLKEKAENLQNLSSLRNQSHKETWYNPFSIKVTPEFQRHVSKHLSALLDEIIDDKQIINKRMKLKKNYLNFGIKLLNSSNNYLLPHENLPKIVKSRKKNSDADDYKKKAKEVAVSPEWVLSQEETKFWALNTKGVIEFVKLDDIC